MRKVANEIYIHSFPGCGVDWAVTPLSRIATVAYLIVGAPILYYYFTRVGRALSAALHFIGYQVGLLRMKLRHATKSFICTIEKLIVDLPEFAGVSTGLGATQVALPVPLRPLGVVTGEQRRCKRT